MLTEHDPLRWNGADNLSPAVREAVLGPGAPFEMVTEDVLGVPLEVFAQRPHSMAAVLSRAATDHADRVYVSFPDATLTYAEFAAEVDRLAGLLADRYSIGVGNRVAIVSANNLGYTLAMWAVMQLGAIMVGLNGWWTSSELKYGVDLTEPSLILGDEPRLARLAAIEDGVTATVVSFSDLLDQLKDSTAPAPAVTIDEDDPAVVMFTSGTTGRPKGVTTSHRALAHFGQVNLFRGLVGALAAGITPDPSIQSSSICVSPLFHVSGSVPLFGAPWTGAKIVYPPAGRWDEAQHIRLTAAHNITQWSGVPTQLFRLIEHPDLDQHDLSSLRSVGSGGANMPPELIRLYTERMPAVMMGTGYGSTETAGLGTGIGGPQYVANPTSIGGPIPSSQVEVRREDGTRVANGEVGEIYLLSASNFLGYWKDDAATEAVMGASRWYRTGDFGRLVDGLIHLEGRGSDLIIRGGENISPLEIENRLIEHPDVETAAIIGVDHLMLGQEILALVIARDGTSPTVEDITAWVGKELAAFKVPAHVRFVAELPYTASGKVHKKALEDEWRSMLTTPELTTAPPAS